MKVKYFNGYLFMTNDLENKNIPSYNGISYMDLYTDEMGLDSGYNVIGRKNELISLDANMLRSRMNSILLLAPAGAGKTAVVESWARHRKDDIRTFSVDLVAMGGQGENKFAERIKALIDEVVELSKTSDKEICLFIDEVHMLGMPNYAVGLESLKPAMARGQIKLIGATTDEEYVLWIQPNQALNQRFQRFDIPEPSSTIVRKILLDMWQKELSKLEPNMELLDTIIDYGRFFPADAQPRKSIKMLDDMIGWHRSQGLDVNEKLLDNRVYATAGINPKWKVDINHLIESIYARVKGQDHAVQQLEGSLNIAVAGLSNPKRPMGTFLFTGSTGTGKTETAKSMAQGLFGTEDALIRFDMSEFQTLQSVDTFRFRIADAIQKRPYAIVLLDEIEKAHPGVIDLLLQITDDGRLTDRYGRQVTFRNAYIIMTTNVGHEVYQEAHEQSEDVTTMVGLIQTALQKKFRPEMLGRIDAIVPFKPLNKEVRDIIGMTRLREFAELLSTKNIQIRLTQKALRYLTREEVSRDTTSGGGRDLNRRIKNKLYVPVAKLLNEPDGDNVAEILIDVFGEMATDNKQQRVSRAKLGIAEYFVHMDDGGYSFYEGDVARKIEATDEDATLLYISEEAYQSHRDSLADYIKTNSRIEEAVQK